jgi:hypothetical protein
MSRLAKLNQPEWPYGVLGCIASAGVGAVQPAFALVIATMVSGSVRQETAQHLMA